MKKFSVISLIMSLILFTALIKNSTKKIDEEIFGKEENLRSLNQEYKNAKLEFEYLSSSEKLLEFQNLYFDEQMVQKELKEINLIKKSSNKLIIKELKIIND
tara:strand:- start:775 stop:1080 length:306 start_codon:yes stop_codon:yes gene_type:complete